VVPKSGGNTSGGLIHPGLAQDTRCATQQGPLCWTGISQQVRVWPAIVIGSRGGLSQRPPELRERGGRRPLSSSVSSFFYLLGLHFPSARSRHERVWVSEWPLFPFISDNIWI